MDVDLIVQYVVRNAEGEEILNLQRPYSAVVPRVGETVSLWETDYTVHINERSKCLLEGIVLSIEHSVESRTYSYDKFPKYSHFVSVIVNPTRPIKENEDGE